MDDWGIKDMHIEYFEAFPPHFTILVSVVKIFKVTSKFIDLIILFLQVILTTPEENLKHLTPPEAFAADDLRGSWTDLYNVQPCKRGCHNESD